ncbi:hypothetical protein BH23BAC1_BH23BAC1_47950 [soil metagenome]
MGDKSRIPLLPPKIFPVENGIERPLWSVMIPCFNNSKTLGKTIKSVLSQDQGEIAMQIMVVDDHTADQGKIKEIVNKTGNGRVGFFSQQKNVGSLRNFETCLNLSKGFIIHILHADDYVHPGFYNKMAHLLETYPQAGAAFCHYYLVDEKSNKLSEASLQQEKAGILPDWLVRIARAQQIQVPAMVVRREVYEKLGAFHSVIYGEDWEMWVRIAAHYPVAYLPETLASYRVHTGSISGRTIRSGQNVRDLRRVINLIQRYLPREEKQKAKKIASKYYSGLAMETAEELISTGDDQAARAQIFEAMRLYPQWKFIKKAAPKYFKTFSSHSNGNTGSLKKQKNSIHQL